MQLHRASGNDWDAIAASEQTAWQKLASRTHGIVTPGNIITLLGAGLVGAGLVVLATKDNTWLAVSLLLVGRLADLADGIVAERTGTKSPFGEVLDASIDKLEIAVAIVVIWLLSLIPTPVFVVLALHAVFNTVISAISQSRGVRLHPSRAGKVAVATQWFVVGGFVLNYGLRLTGFWNAATVLVAWGLFIVFVGLALVSGLGYVRQLKSSYAKK